MAGKEAAGEKPITGRYPELAREMRQLLAGMSARQAARKTGVNYATLSLMLLGDRASMESTVKIAAAFSVDANRLLQLSAFPTVHPPLADPLRRLGRAVDPAPLSEVTLTPGKVGATPRKAGVAPYGRVGERLPEPVRAVEVEGDGMQPFFQDGDILFVHESAEAKNGNTVLALIDYDAILCRTLRQSGTGAPYLEASRGEGNGQRIEAERFRILGIVIGFYRRLA